MSSVFSRIPTLSKFHQFILIRSKISLSSLLRTPTSQLEVILDETFQNLKRNEFIELIVALKDGELNASPNNKKLQPSNDVISNRGNIETDNQFRIDLNSNFSSNSASEVKDLVGEFAKRQKISKDDIREILNHISYHHRVAITRDLGKRMADDEYIGTMEIDFRTSLPKLDLHLGGVVSGILMELVGPAGVGKTQWSITMAIEKLAQMSLNSEDTILYIDTEDIDIHPRMKQIASLRFSDEETRNRILSRMEQIHIIRFKSSQEMSKFFKDDLEGYLLENRVTLIILDSIAYLIRKEFAGNAKLLERQSVLLEYASKLKELSSSLRIPIIITNHVVQSDYNANDFNNDPKRSRDDLNTTLKAALGNTWSHCINTRLILQEPQPGNKQVIIDKSISSGRKVIRYVIEPGGVFQHPEQSDETDRSIPNTIKSRIGIFQHQPQNYQGPPLKRPRLESDLS